MSLALVIVAAAVFGTIAFALLGVHRIKMDPVQYIVGGRSFGTVFLWVLLAGEIYTTFTFLGVAGLAYTNGVASFYAMCFGTCAYIIGYFITPAIWQVAKEHNLLTGADFFELRYRSRALGVGCALLYFCAVVPYVALQLSGLQIILRIAGYGAYNATVSVVVGFLVMAGFVFTAGLRGTAWASVVKDAFILVAVFFAGIAIPVRFFGSPAGLFDRVAAVHPQLLVVPHGAGPHGMIWFVSSVMLSACGFFMGPQTMNAIFSARSGEALRRNAILLPLYQSLLALLLFAGFSAALLVPGLKGPAADQSFLLVLQRFFPTWILGIVCAAGALAALVPASALLLAGASVITETVVHSKGTLLTRVLVIVVALLALGVWLVGQKTVVELLLLYYNGIAQLLPAAAATFVWPRATAWGAGAGIATGVGVAIALSLANLTPWGINAGLIGLAVNVVVFIIVSLATPRKVQS